MDQPILTEAATAALRLAAAERPPGGNLTTGRVFAMIARIDAANDWDRLWLHTGEPAGLQLADAPDTDSRNADETWENVPLSGDMAAAMATLCLISDKYTLVPVPTGVLALALVADPRSGAARVLTVNGWPHAELLEIIQDDLIGTSLDGLRDAVAGKRTAGQADLPATELLRLAADRAADRTAGLVTGRIPDEMDILAILLTQPKAGELLERMGLDQALLEETEEPLRAIGLHSAVKVSPADDGDSSMHLLAGLAQSPSPGLSWLLRLTGINRTDIEAEAIDAAATTAGRSRRVGVSVILLGILNVLLSIIIMMLLIVHVVGPGSLWELLLIPLIWLGYPRWPSGVALIIAVPLYFLVSPVVGVLQLVAGLSDWLQARAERRGLIARTGVVVSYGVLRRVSLRRLRKGRLSLLWRRELRIRLLRPRMLNAASKAAESTVLDGPLNVR